MKHFYTALWLCLTVLGLCFFTDADAQVRNKKTSVRKTTTTQRKTSTVKPKTSSSQKATPQFAFYGKLGAHHMYVGDSLIFYVEENHNNAVMAIDRKTGEKSVIIPGIDGVYEGARKQVIKKFLISGGRQFLVLKDGYSDDDGVYLYEGSVKQARLLENSMWLLASSDKYLFVKSSNRINGKFSCELWDTEKLKVVQQWPVSFPVEPTAKIANDGSVWIWESEFDNNSQKMVFGVRKLGIDGKITFNKLSDQPYIVENDINEGKKDLYLMGDYLYNRCHRRIYRINTTDPNAKWEEYARIPPTQNSEFVWYCIDSEGNMLTCGSSDVRADYRCQYWTAGNYDSPKPLGTEVTTGINDYGYRSIDPKSYSRQVDADGNFILLYFDGSELCIYNPNGVVGYTKARGTVIK